MWLLKRGKETDPETFALSLSASLREPLGAPGSSQPTKHRLPGNPWARRLVVALEEHVQRQEWVAKVVRDELHADPLAIAARGGGAHPVRASPEVPGLPGWSARFHGIGCCLTHRDGTVIDVDFDEHGAEGVDPYFFGRYLASLPQPRGIAAMLRRPEPLDEWWMAEIESLRELRWIAGKHRVRLTALGARWAAALRPGFAVIAEEKDSAAQLRAAFLLEDFPWAAQLDSAPSLAVQRRAERCAAVRASQLEPKVRRSRASQARWAFAAMAVLDGERAAQRATKILQRGWLDGLTSLALRYLQSREPGPKPHLLLALSKRAKGTTPPASYLRTRAIAAILKAYRADSLPETLRPQILEHLLPDAHASEGVAALLLTLLDREAGFARLGRCLRHPVPLAREDAAAALTLFGTPEAAALLGEAGDIAEAKAGLALLRGFPPTPGPLPEGKVVEWQGVRRRVFSMDEILASNCPSLVESELAGLSEEFGPLLDRWWAQ